MKKENLIPVTLEGPNYLLWSRVARVILGSHGLWDSHIMEAETSKRMALEDKQATCLKHEDKWVQEEHQALGIIHRSLSEQILEDHYHLKTAKNLWEKLQNVYGNLWESLQAVYEQDKIFSLLLNLDSPYNSLISHIIQERKLPSSHGSQPSTLKLKEFEHQVIEGRTMYSALCGDSNEGGTWRSMAGATNSDGPVTRRDFDSFIRAAKALISPREVGKNSPDSKPIIIDSGASHHMISDRNLVSNIKPASGNVLIANGDKVRIEGIGNLRLFDKESTALYMPQFTSNLLSVKRATIDLNCQVVFRPDEVEFQDLKTGQVIGRGHSHQDLYHLEKTKISGASPAHCLISDSNGVESTIWHSRLGHPHTRALNLMLPGMVFQNDECEACILGKHCRTVFPRSSTSYEKCFDLVHSDVWTAPCISRENHKYFVTFIDEKSKYTWVTLIQTKDRVLEAFKNFHNHVSNHFNAKLKILRSDNGGEYTSQAFKQYLAQHGIIQQTSCPYTPQQNGVAERKNRHLMEVARSMMFHTSVPKRFWGDAVVTACYLINRIPTRILQDHSPFEVLNKTRPSIDHMRVFGCLCFVLIPGEQRNKLEAKSTRAMFIGYSPNQKGYKCYEPETRRVLVSRDVKFVESRGYYNNKDWSDLENLSQSTSDRASNLRRVMESIGISIPMEKKGTGSDETRQAPTQSSEAETNTDESEGQEVPHLDHEGGNNNTEPIHDQDEQQDQEDQEAPVVNENQTLANEEEVQHEEPQPVLRRSTRIKRPASNWINTRVYFNSQAVAHPTQATCSLAQYPMDHQAFTTNLDEAYIPRSYEEAMAIKEWRDSVGDEMGAMEKNGTWFETELPKGKKAVTSMLLFTIKYLANGKPERKKTRLVARGYTQVYGEDYLETFAPVAKLHTIRIVLSLAVNLEWDLWQMDVKNAFLQGELEDEVYMRPPPGMEGMVKPGNVLRLRKAIYGLKQSPRAWYHKLSTTLNGRGFVKSEADHTLFTLTSQQGIIVILIYVDDIIITGSDKEGINSTKAFLKATFDIKDLGELKYFLGIEMCRSKEGLFLSQRKYTLDLLKEAGDLGGRAAKTPLEEGYKVMREGEYENKAYGDVKHYRRMVGKLIYLTITRPDVCFAVNQVSQHMQAPKMHHWNMVERILRYLREAPGQGVWMGCNKSTEIVGYCDADWAGDRIDRRSTTGYCTFIGGNLVTWKSKKQKVVSCSSAEAEYRAMRKLTSELIWIKGLLKDLGIETTTPITMHCDNQAAIHIASNSVFHERTKHIEVDCHKVRQAVEQKVILPCYTRSEDQLADIFTKAASTKVCELIHPRLGLIDLSCH